MGIQKGAAATGHRTIQRLLGCGGVEEWCRNVMAGRHRWKLWKHLAMMMWDYVGIIGYLASTL